uniref:Secreted protein n=1 Tax=Micrurus lemniscatus lemniscatus TaxID=129467 RepID=A0A2D4H7K5_MICLE
MVCSLFHGFILLFPCFARLDAARGCHVCVCVLCSGTCQERGSVWGKIWSIKREFDLSKMIGELLLQDTWRAMNPGTKQYTFYSNVHQSWSIIDMIWMTPELRGNVQEIEIAANL